MSSGPGQFAHYRPDIFVQPYQFPEINSSLRIGGVHIFTLGPMKYARILTSSLILFVGALVLLFGLLYAFGPDLAKTTIEHNRQLDKTFQEAARFVTSYQAQHGHLPSSKVFEAWTTTYPLAPYTSPNSMLLQLDSFPEEAIKEFGPSSKNSFLLVYWRGEWFEYYASWANRSSLVFEPSKYYALGSKYADGFIVIVVAVIILALGWRL